MVEPNEVLRGFVFEPVQKSLCQQAQDIFEMSVSVKTLSFADLYGGKICAALDRQHPRDIFDIKMLLENEGITPKILKAFVIYLAGHDRPMNELLDPVRQDIKTSYDKAFQGMVVEPVSYEALLDVREQYITAVKQMLTVEERKFLISLKEGEPDWALLGLKGIDKLPAIQWKAHNIRTLKEKNPKKHSALLKKLKSCLGM